MTSEQASLSITTGERGRGRVAEVLNIVIPMAGRGSRFAGSAVPKPLIELEPGRPMIGYILDFLEIEEAHQTIFLARAQHESEFGISRALKDFAPGAAIVRLNEETRGPADTVLRAAAILDEADEIVVAYCDGFSSIRFADFVDAARAQKADGALLTSPSSDPGDSYAVIDDGGRVLRTAEKQIISPDATTGVYYFRRAGDMFDAARAAIADAAPGGPEIFVSSLYNHLIGHGGLVVSFAMRPDQRFDAGTPARLADVQRRLAAARGR